MTVTFCAVRVSPGVMLALTSPVQFNSCAPTVSAGRAAWAAAAAGEQQNSCAEYGHISAAVGHTEARSTRAADRRQRCSSPWGR